MLLLLLLMIIMMTSSEDDDVKLYIVNTFTSSFDVLPGVVVVPYV